MSSTTTTATATGGAGAGAGAEPIFIFDNPRNRSHLFFRYLMTHPALEAHYHPYVTAGCLGPDKLHYDIYGPERAALVREHWEPYCQDAFTFEAADREMEAAISAIEQQQQQQEGKKKEKKIPVVNEHCCYVLRREMLVEAINARRLPDVDDEVSAGLGNNNNNNNPTRLPDDLWRRLRPVIVIRHPALSLPSLMRSFAGVPALADLDPRENHTHWFATLGWSRLLFDALRRRDPGGRPPVVVSGEDVCTRTAEVGEAVCSALGLDNSGGDKLTDKWEPLGLGGGSAERSLEDLGRLGHPLFREMTRTIWESDGVVKHEDTGPLDIDATVAKYEVEFGPEVAAKMRTVVEEEMDNFRYLEQFKV